MSDEIFIFLDVLDDTRITVSDWPNIQGNSNAKFPAFCRSNRVAMVLFRISFKPFLGRFIALCRGLLVPSYGGDMIFPNPPASLVKLADVIHCPSVASISGQPVAAHRLVIILRHAQSVAIKASHVPHRDIVALFCGLAKPTH